MHLRDLSSELRLQLLHATPAQSPSEPDIHVEVSAHVGKFAAHEVRVWLEWPDVSAFIDELVALVRDFKGQAKLLAMSPEDFELTISSLDSTGHFGAHFVVGSRTYTRSGQPLPCSLRGSLELELSHVEEVLRWFKAVQAGRADA